MKKVRYLTVSRMAVEVVSKLTEHEKALFLDILYSAFKQIENGEPVTVPAVDGVLSVILDEAISELETGFKNYRQKMTAVEMAMEKKRLKELKEMGIDPDEIGDTSANDPRTIGDTLANDPRPTLNNTLPHNTLPNKPDDTGRDTGNPAESCNGTSDEELLNLQAYQLQAWLQGLGIGFDNDILTAWKENGFDAIRQAVNRLSGVEPPVKKTVFLELVREEGNRV